MPLILLAAGGTGGHLFPAEALASALEARGARTALVTDRRASEFVSRFPADATHQVPAATPSGRSPLRMAGAAMTLGLGVAKSLLLLRRLKPDAVVGFGGYPTVPPVLAATLLGIPTILHEQNAVMGRANRFLAVRVGTIATGFATVRGHGVEAGKLVHVGNPVRDQVLAVAGEPYPPALKGGKLRLLVFGGSQGARVMADVVPEAIKRLPGDLIKRLVVTQQARGEDLPRVKGFYDHYQMKAEVEPFFKDLPRRIAESHLVLARSGASTVAELAAIGRPAILVPLPGALDQDQAANAKSLGDIGAASVIAQPDFTPERLAQELSERMNEPERLTEAARAAKTAGRPDAADRLATLVLERAAKS